MADTGELIVGTGVADSGNGGDDQWVFPGRITADDGSETFVTIGSGDTSWWLVGTNISAAIPTGATIDGVEVRVEARISTADSQVTVSSVTLWNGGAPIGTAKAPGTNLTTSPAVYVFGGPADDWDGSLTEALVEGSGFGAAFEVNQASISSRTISIDYMSITVYYSDDTQDITLQAIPSGTQFFNMSVSQAGAAQNIELDFIPENQMLTAFAESSDGWIVSGATLYSEARDGTGSALIVNSAGDTSLLTGQSFVDFHSLPFQLTEMFVNFDVSTILPTEQALEVALQYWLLEGGTAEDFTLEVRLYDWGDTLEPEDWVPGDDLSGLTLLASIDTSALGATGEYKTFVNENALFTAIEDAASGDGILRTIVISSRLRLNLPPDSSGASSDEFIIFSSTEREAGTTQDPQLDVTYRALGTSEVFAPNIIYTQDISLQHISAMTQLFPLTVSFEEMRLITPGRKIDMPPEFTLVFTGPLPDDKTLVRMGLPRETDLQFASELPGGWSRASAGVTRPELRRTLNAQTYQALSLPENLTAPAFANSLIYDEGGEVIWEGRISNRHYSGGEIRGATMTGYGITGLKDTRMPPGSGKALTPGVVRRIVDASSIITPLEISGPNVAWDWSEFNNQLLYNVMEALSEAGCGTCPGWTWTVYHRKLRFFGYIPPDVPDYVIPNDETIERSIDNEEVYTRVILGYTNLNGESKTVDVRNREAEKRFGISRELPISGGQMTASAATAYARTELIKRSRINQAVTITREWSRGLETLFGSKPVWRVRAGEWVQIGESEDMQPIESISYSQRPGTATIQLGLPVSDDTRSQWRRLMRMETAIRTGRNTSTRT